MVLLRLHPFDSHGLREIDCQGRQVKLHQHSLSTRQVLANTH